MKLVDTTVAVDHLRGHEAATAVLEDLAVRGEPALASELLRYELIAGVRPDERDDLEAFFATLDWVPVTEDLARRGGELAQRFRASHGGIDDIDYLVAATADALGADLLTSDVRHFPMFEGLAAPY